jgi:hypothetical protein
MRTIIVASILGDELRLAGCTDASARPVRMPCFPQIQGNQQEISNIYRIYRETGCNKG